MPSARMSWLCATAHTAGVDLHAIQQQDQAITDMSRHVHRYVTPGSKFICSEPQRLALQGEQQQQARL